MPSSLNIKTQKLNKSLGQPPASNISKVAMLVPIIGLNCVIVFITFYYLYAVIASIFLSGVDSSYGIVLTYGKHYKDFGDIIGLDGLKKNSVILTNIIGSIYTQAQNCSLNAHKLLLADEFTAFVNNLYGNVNRMLIYQFFLATEIGSLALDKTTLTDFVKHVSFVNDVLSLTVKRATEFISSFNRGMVNISDLSDTIEALTGQFSAFVPKALVLADNATYISVQDAKKITINTSSFPDLIPPSVVSEILKFLLNNPIDVQLGISGIRYAWTQFLEGNRPSLNTIMTLKPSYPTTVELSSNIGVYYAPEIIIWHILSSLTKFIRGIKPVLAKHGDDVASDQEFMINLMRAGADAGLHNLSFLHSAQLIEDFNHEALNKLGSQNNDICRLTTLVASSKGTRSSASDLGFKKFLQEASQADTSLAGLIKKLNVYHFLDNHYAVDVVKTANDIIATMTRVVYTSKPTSDALEVTNDTTMSARWEEGRELLLSIYESLNANAKSQFTYKDIIINSIPYMRHNPVK